MIWAGLCFFGGGILVACAVFIDKARKRRAPAINNDRLAIVERSRICAILMSIAAFLWSVAGGLMLTWGDWGETRRGIPLGVVGWIVLLGSAAIAVRFLTQSVKHDLTIRLGLKESRTG
jgi:hypothetical protein